MSEKDVSSDLISVLDLLSKLDPRKLDCLDKSQVDHMVKRISEVKSQVEKAIIIVKDETKLENFKYFSTNDYKDDLDTKLTDKQCSDLKDFIDQCLGIKHALQMISSLSDNYYKTSVSLKVRFYLFNVEKDSDLDLYPIVKEVVQCGEIYYIAFCDKTSLHYEVKTGRIVRRNHQPVV